MDAARQVTATFNLLLTVPTYTLTVVVSPAVGGTVTPNPPGRVYTEPLVYDGGTVVTLTANPASGYEFIRWSGDLTGMSSTMIITMTQDRIIIANFKQSGFIIYLPLVVKHH
ncbi:MAG: hypothetical protein V3S14_10200 [Anaerolineae bacterium]